MVDNDLDDDLIYFNGLNGSTGTYDLLPMTREALYGLISGESTPENLDDLQSRYEQGTVVQFGVMPGVDRTKLEETGWGVIFAHNADPAIKESLSELLQWREKQAGHLFRIYEGPNAYRPGETKRGFLNRHGVMPGAPANPQQMPYYLLIVGSPEVIPYSFQYQLDVEYAVGRIYFEKIEDYASYARSVVQAEKEQEQKPHTMTFFSVVNADDKSTPLSDAFLISPLLDSLQDKYQDWSFNLIQGREATKERLGNILHSLEKPTVLFTASHGMKFALNDSRQLRHQGAIVCQDWPGPLKWPSDKKNIPQDFYFAGDDLTNEANLQGSIVFQFACYGAGTPELDDFGTKIRKKIAPYSFVSQLPMKLLSLSKGGALAFVGHVDRAWGYSFQWPGTKFKQTDIFEYVLSELLEGYPVGAAIEYLNGFHASLATELNDEKNDIQYGKRPQAEAYTHLWTATNDTRNYTIFGDPAARLHVPSY